jgi:hypothetical protein
MIDSRFTSFLKVVMLVLIPFAMVMALKECHDQQREAHSMNEDQNVLMHNGRVEIGQTQSGKPMASVSAISLKPSSLKRNPDSLLAVTSKDLKIKPRRMVAAIKTSSLATADIHAAITTDSIYDEADKDSNVLLSYPRSPQQVSWSDPWMSLRGTIRGDSFTARIESRDTLQMIIHRVPRKFLFFRYGTKGVRMDVVSQNPHTRLSYPKVILFTK